MAWTLRFINNARKPAQHRKLDRISLEEIVIAISHVLRLLQRRKFGKEYESLMKSNRKRLHLIDQLNLYLDEGLIKG